MNWKLICLAAALAWVFSVYCMFNWIIHPVVVIILFFTSILLFSLGLTRIWEGQGNTKNE